MCAALALAAAPSAQAAAQDAPSAAVTGLFDRLATEFLPQVASSTALSRQLPTLAVTPAESVDLRTAFADLFKAGGPLEDAASPDRPRGLGRLRRRRRRRRLGLHGQRQRQPSSPSASRARSPGRRPGHPRHRRHDQPVERRRHPRHRPAHRLVHLRLRRHRGPGLADQALDDHRDHRRPAARQEINAGLGILGVAVIGDAGDSEADYHLESTVTTSWANPDNDAAGSLAFDNPATATADDGELAAEGAGTGIVTATQVGHPAGQPRREAPRQRPGRRAPERRRRP